MQSNNGDILLRAAEPYDAETIYNWENDREIWKVSETIVPYSLHTIKEFLLNNNDLLSQKQLRLMIEGVKGKSQIGCIDIYEYDVFNQRAGIGILIDKDFRNKGFAKKSVELLLDYCFNILLLKQIYIRTHIDNVFSIKLFESLGFIKCAHRRQWLRTADGFIDELEYQLINN
ncbi:MAG: GNAT family N-acetyltransferase [Candidatus Limimorpha sp.]